MAHEVLHYGAMRRSVLVLVLLAAFATTASAGVYVGAGIGTGGYVNGDFDSKIGLEKDGRSLRLFGGYQFGKISVELIGMGWDLHRSTTVFQVRQLAIAGKYSFPIGYNFELFPRVGVLHTWFTGDGAFEGNGVLLGGGVEYRIKGVLAGMSVFVDYTQEIFGVWDESYSFNTYPGLFSIGASLSF